MHQNRKQSTAIVDAYVAAKEIRLIAACADSRKFDAVWLYEKCLALPEPPDQKERRCSAKTLVKAARVILARNRPELAAAVFEKSFFLVQDSKSGIIRSKTLAGVLECWQKMGKPKIGLMFVNQALIRIEELQGVKARTRQEKQLAEALDKASP